MSSAIVFYGEGGYWTATLSSVFYGSLANLEYHNILPSMSEIITDIPQQVPENILYNTSANIAAFYLVAFLSSHLSRQVKAAEDELNKFKNKSAIFDLALEGSEINQKLNGLDLRKEALDRQLNYYPRKALPGPSGDSTGLNQRLNYSLIEVFVGHGVPQCRLNQICHS